MNIFESLNKIDDNKSLRESFTDGKYCIVAVTNDGNRKFYKDGTFIDDCKNCTVFTDLDEARDVWHEIDKSGFRRVFVPNWSEDMFCESKEVETMLESTPHLAVNEYKLTYYENTAGRDRRPETVEDFEHDWHEITFRADSDLDAWLSVFETITEDSWEDYMETDPTEDDIKEYFDDADWSDGSPILIKLESSDNVLFDSGYDKESWADEFIGYDDNYDYDDEYSEYIDLFEITSEYTDEMVREIVDNNYADDVFEDAKCAYHFESIGIIVLTNDNKFRYVYMTSNPTGVLLYDSLEDILYELACEDEYDDLKDLMIKEIKNVDAASILESEPKED